MRTSAALFTLAFAVMCTLPSCSPKQGQQSLPVIFPSVTVSPMESDPAGYSATHFFNRLFDTTRVFNPDTSLVMGVSRENFSQAFAEYSKILSMTNLQTGVNAQRLLLSKAEEYQTAHPESNIWPTVLQLSDLFFNDPNSPLRSEDLYVPVLEAIVASPLVDSLDKLTPQYKLPLYRLNTIGTTANDFKFKTADGRISSLYRVEAEFVLILFSNPGCEACKAIIDYIKDNVVFDDMISSGRLKVVNCYPDKDLGHWYEYLKVYPKEWINCHDHLQALNGREIYNIRAIPSLYLLDSEKTVLLKDAPLETVEAVLTNIRMGR